jgi:hypothetical protein
MNSTHIPKIVYEYIPSGRRKRREQHNEGRLALLPCCCAVAAAADDDDAKCYCTDTVFICFSYVVIMLAETFSII